MDAYLESSDEIWKFKKGAVLVPPFLPLHAAEVNDLHQGLF
jgi:hypothetical protein